MTDQKAEVDIENVERYARVDTKPEPDGNLGTYESKSVRHFKKYLCRVS